MGFPGDPAGRPPAGLRGPEIRNEPQANVRGGRVLPSVRERDTRWPLGGGRGLDIRRHLVAASAGALLAATCVAWGGADVSAELAGTVVGASPHDDVLVVATRNDCADPARRPLVLGMAAQRGPGPFRLEVNDVGPGVAWVCALERGSGSIERYARARVPRSLRPDAEGVIRIDGLELRLVAGPPIPELAGPLAERDAPGTWR